MGSGEQIISSVLDMLKCRETNRQVVMSVKVSYIFKKFRRFWPRSRFRGLQSG